MIETFITAFTTATTAHGRCDCGRIFEFNDVMPWEDGAEIVNDELSETTYLKHKVVFIEFDRRSYVSACTCWEKKAERIMQFLNANSIGIAQYLNGERARKIREAEQTELINILSKVDVQNKHVDNEIDDIPF